MFKWRIISRSNINGKVHTFQKDFDDYESYQDFIHQNPEYNTPRLFDSWIQPWAFWDNIFPQTYTPQITTPLQSHLPEGVDLAKYEKRLQDKRVERAEIERKKSSLESSLSWIDKYLEENPEDQEAKEDREKIQKELEWIRS